MSLNTAKLKPGCLSADCCIFSDRRLKNFCPRTKCLFAGRHRFWCQRSEDDGQWAHYRRFAADALYTWHWHWYQLCFNLPLCVCVETQQPNTKHQAY